jgi:hypothetical protein
LNKIRQENINSGQRIIFNTKNLNPKHVQELQQEVKALGWPRQVGYVTA